MDLNVDCQLLILEQMGMSALIALAETNKFYSKLIPSVLKPRFVTKTFIDQIDGYIHETDESIRVESLTAILKVLKHAGHLMRNLIFEQSLLKSAMVKTIQKRINLYCAETLTHFHVVYAFQISFDEFTTPFQKVEKVVLNGKFQNLSNEVLNFSEIFPTMQSLTLSSANISNTNWVDQSYPQLKHLNIHAWNTYGLPKHFMEELAAKLFKNNPQIQNLELDKVSPKLLKLVADELPQLDRLGIEHYDEGSLDQESYQFRFKTVKVFKMHLGVHSMPSNIVFENLEEFQTDAHPDGCSRWFQFITRSKNSLKKLRIQHYLSNEEILQLAVMK